jgi:uncharacterized protein YjiS (DUF1127 family)
MQAMACALKDRQGRAKMATYDDTDRVTLLGMLARQLNVGALRHLDGTIGSWLARSRQRKALAELDDRLLRDIGITPTEAIKEANRPFCCGGKA